MDLNPLDNYLHGSWEALGNAAPTLVALAQLCSERWVNIEPEKVTLEGLPNEALAILLAASRRGTIELRAVNAAFDPAARLLAVYVELEPDQVMVFRDKERPEITVQFLEGFRQLCDRGLVIHHIYGDFSLAPRGIELGRMIDSAAVRSIVENVNAFGSSD